MVQNLKKKLMQSNPVSVYRRNRMRKEIRNTGATFLCPNCIGGILFHDLGLQFRSPTVNTMMIQPDFVKFVLNLEEYLEKDLEFFQNPLCSYPCAKLGDITIHFTHYHTEQEASAKWIERAQRIDYDNLFIFLMQRDGLSDTDIERIGAVRARGLVIFTNREYPNLPYTVYIKQYRNDQSVGNVLKQSYFSGRRDYERYFDFVKWFNEADGSFDVSPFRRV